MDCYTIDISGFRNKVVYTCDAAATVVVCGTPRSDSQARRNKCLKRGWGSPFRPLSLIYTSKLLDTACIDRTLFLLAWTFVSCSLLCSVTRLYRLCGTSPIPYCQDQLLVSSLTCSRGSPSRKLLPIYPYPAY